MKNRYVRPLVGAMGALVACVAAAIPVATQNPAPTSAWNVGDVFAGVGRFEKHPGKYVVLDATGTPTGQVLEDPFAGLTGTTTGCAIDFDAGGEALFATTFGNRSLTRFDAASPHPASEAFALGETGAGHTNLAAVESIVFDGNENGFYYVGGQWPVADSAADYENRRGYIFKFDRQHQLVDTFEVPADQSGVDWLDLGSDKTTIYYTSEFGNIHVYETAMPYDATLPFGGRHSVIPVTDGGTQIGSRAQAMRLLPPDPDDPALKPSGFLVTTSDNGVFRLNASGQKIAEYQAPGLTGSYFGLNLTPDGQSFWTATYQVYPDWAVYCPGGEEFDENNPDWCVLYNTDTEEYDLPPPEPEGKIVRFHIASGAITAGPISIELDGLPVDNVWGLCVKREYTAASNDCYELNADGTAVLDTDGQPISIACQVPVFCPDDPTHPDCVVPGSPALFLPEDQENFEGDEIDGIYVTASHPNDQPMTLVVTGLPDHLEFVQLNGTTGVIRGTVSWFTSSHLPYVIRVTAYDGPIGAPGTKSVSDTFEWLVHHRNGPPQIWAPPDITIPAGVALSNPIVFGTSDPDLDSLVVTVTGLPPGLTAPTLVQHKQGVGLSGTPIAAGTYTPSVCVWDQQPGREPVCASMTIQVVTNRPPVCTGAMPSQALWPPNHKFVPIHILGVTDPDGDPITIAIMGVQQDEPVLTPGSGHTDADGRIDGATAYVRAERAGTGDGRVYEIFFTASDGIASCAGSVLVGVPHSQGKAGKPGQQAAVDSGVRYDSLTGAVIIGPSGASGPPGRRR